ncbi:MAG: hypothetical protein ACI9W2_002272 [Gammaproteobacteria bacterium]|jgi:hypothetical protein
MPKYGGLPQQGARGIVVSGINLQRTGPVCGNRLAEQSTVSVLTLGAWVIISNTTCLRGNQPTGDDGVCTKGKFIASEPLNAVDNILCAQRPELIDGQASGPRQMCVDTRLVCSD